VGLEEMLHNHLADLAAAPVVVLVVVLLVARARLFQLAAVAVVVAEEYCRGPEALVALAVLQPAALAVAQALLVQKPVHLIPALVVEVAAAGVHLEPLELLDQTLAV
jgi:hypothetical protein